MELELRRRRCTNEYRVKSIGSHLVSTSPAAPPAASPLLRFAATGEASPSLGPSEGLPSSLERFMGSVRLLPTPELAAPTLKRLAGPVCGKTSQHKHAIPIILTPAVDFGREMVKCLSLATCAQGNKLCKLEKKARIRRVLLEAAYLWYWKK